MLLICSAKLPRLHLQISDWVSFTYHIKLLFLFDIVSIFCFFSLWNFIIWLNMNDKSFHRTSTHPIVS